MSPIHRLWSLLMLIVLLVTTYQPLSAQPNPYWRQDTGAQNLEVVGHLGGPVQRFDTPGVVHTLALAGDLVYAADGLGGLWVLRFTPPVGEE